MALTLLGSLVCFAVWLLLAFVRPIGLGIVHLLWAASAVLWIRWYALRTLPGKRLSGKQ
ncbi:MAG TPA: hypothetical protein VGP61_01260 [Gemmatimonadales bacterium]|jgi:hypothetical protein|nr:hypothetical protein [Gemmatimonadales bacterium]